MNDKTQNDGAREHDETERIKTARSTTAPASGAAVAAAKDAVEGGVRIHQAAEAHRRMPNLKAANVDTPQFQGHVFEQMATDAHNARHPLHRWRLNGTCNEAATDATSANGTKLQMKKGNGQSDGPRTEAHLRGRRNNNRMIQKLGLDKLDRAGYEDGKVVTTKGDRVLDDPRVVESPVSRARVEQATERYAQALQGLSRQDLTRLAKHGAKEGALIGGGLSVGFAVYGLVTGALEWDEAAEQVVVSTAAAALGGAVGKVVAGVLEATSASAGEGAAVVAPRIGQVLGRAGIVGVAVCGVCNVGINGYAAIKGDKALDAAVRDAVKGTAFGATGVAAAAGVATIGAVAAAPAAVTVVVVGGAATATTVLAEHGFNRARNRLFGDPRSTALVLITAAEAELVDAVAEYEGVSVVDLLDRLGLDSVDGSEAETA